MFFKINFPTMPKTKQTKKPAMPKTKQTKKPAIMVAGDLNTMLYMNSSVLIRLLKYNPNDPDGYYDNDVEIQIFNMLNLTKRRILNVNNEGKYVLTCENGVRKVCACRARELERYMERDLPGIFNKYPDLVINFDAFVYGKPIECYASLLSVYEHMKNNITQLGL